MKGLREEGLALFVAFTAIAVIFCMAIATMQSTAEDEKIPSSPRSFEQPH